MAGMLCAGIFLALVLIIHGNIYFYYGFRDVLTLVLGGGILAVFMGAIGLSLVLLVGRGENRNHYSPGRYRGCGGDPGSEHADQFPDRGGRCDRYTVLYQSGDYSSYRCGRSMEDPCFLSALIYEKTEW